MYLVPQQIMDEIGGQARLNEALDDENSGDATVIAATLTRVMQRGCDAVDAFLAGRYVVPLSPVPALAIEAALIFTCEIIYNRRRQSTDERNPYTARANDLRDRLKRIADRKESLDAKDRPAFTPGAVISTASATQGSSL